MYVHELAVAAIGFEAAAVPPTSPARLRSLAPLAVMTMMMMMVLLPLTSAHVAVPPARANLLWEGCRRQSWRDWLRGMKPMGWCRWGIPWSESFLGIRARGNGAGTDDVGIGSWWAAASACLEKIRWDGCCCYSKIVRRRSSSHHQQHQNFEMRCLVLRREVEHSLDCGIVRASEYSRFTYVHMMMFLRAALMYINNTRPYRPFFLLI